jgi:hypothetical protein
MAMKIEQIRVRKKRRPVVLFLVIIFFVGLAALTTYVLIGKFPQTTKPVVIKKVVVPLPTLPAGWERYTSEQNGFSIGHQIGYIPRETVSNVSAVETATTHAGFGVSFQKSNETELSLEFAPIEIRVTHQTLDQAVAGRKSIAAEDHNVAYKSQITGEQPITVAGKLGTRIDEKDVDQTPRIEGQTEVRQPDIYRTFVFVESHGLTYALQTTWQQKGDYGLPLTQQMIATFAFIDKN